MAKKFKELPDIILNGQISIFDIDIIEKPKKVIENKVLGTKIDKSYNVCHQLSQAQEKIISKYKTKSNLYRIIHYGGGGVGIELKNGEEFKTIYVNHDGVEELKWDKQIRVLDMDKIIFVVEHEKESKINTSEAVKVGDYVKAYYSKNEIIEGTITHTYGIANECLCINFMYKGKKSNTAIPRLNVIEIIKEERICG